MCPVVAINLNEASHVLDKVAVSKREMGLVCLDEINPSYIPEPRRPQAKNFELKGLEMSWSFPCGDWTG